MEAATDKKSFSVMCYNFHWDWILATAVFCTSLCDCHQFSKDIERYRAYGGSLDLQDAFDVFYSEPFKSMQKVSHLMNIFNKHCPNITTFFPNMVRRKRHVFIAIEGTHRETKQIITKMLARKLRGKFKFSPPYYLVSTGEKYSDSKTMSRAFYCLGYYATAYSTVLLLPHQPVITGGYWLDQLAFGVVAAFPNEIPPPDSPLYTWPRDLLVPDATFFLNLPSHNLKNTFTEGDPLTFRSKLIQFYRNWGKHPPLIEINTTNVHRDVTRIMLRHIEQKLGYIQHLQPEPPSTPWTIHSWFTNTAMSVTHPSFTVPPPVLTDQPSTVQK